MNLCKLLLMSGVAMSGCRFLQSNGATGPTANADGRHDGHKAAPA